MAIVRQHSLFVHGQNEQIKNLNRRRISKIVKSVYSYTVRSVDRKRNFNGGATALTKPH